MVIKFTLTPLPNQDEGNYPQMTLPNVPSEEAENIVKSLRQGGTTDRYISYEHTGDGQKRFFYIDSSRIIAAGAHPDEVAED